MLPMGVLHVMAVVCWVYHGETSFKIQAVAAVIRGDRL
jgi:hypothetical protein